MTKCTSFIIHYKNSKSDTNRYIYAVIGTQIIEKVNEILQKASFLKACHFSINQYFPYAKTSVVGAVSAKYISRKRNWHQVVTL